MSKNRDLANYGTAALEDASVSATGDSVVKRDASGNVSAVDVYASGNVLAGITSSPYKVAVEAPENLFYGYSTTHAAEMLIKGTATNVLTIAGGTGDNIAFATNGSTETMRIDSAGDILHGGTAKLSPKALDRGIYIQSSGNASRAGVSFFTNDANNNYRGVHYLDDATGAFGWDMTLSTGDMKYTWSYLSNEQMRLNNTGNLLIGTTTDNGVDKLQVEGNLRWLVQSTTRSNSDSGTVVETKEVTKTHPDYGGSGILTSAFGDTPTHGELYVHELGTNNFLNATFFKRSLSHDPVVTVLSSSSLFVQATNNGGTVLISGFSNGSNVKMMSKIRKIS